MNRKVSQTTTTQLNIKLFNNSSILFSWMHHEQDRLWVYRGSGGRELTGEGVSFGVLGTILPARGSAAWLAGCGRGSDDQSRLEGLYSQ